MPDFLKVLATVAPSIASAFGTPLLGTAVAACEAALGIIPAPNASIESRQDSIAQKIVSATPDDLLKLKVADNQHAEEMAKLGYENAQAIASLQVKDKEIDANDRSSAREREKAIKDKIPALLAVFITLGFFGILSYMLQSAVPNSNRDVLNIMLGALGTAWISVISYYFGSSAGSDRKTEIMANKETQNASVSTD